MLFCSNSKSVNIINLAAWASEEGIREAFWKELNGCDWCPWKWKGTLQAMTDNPKKRLRNTLKYHLLGIAAGWSSRNWSHKPRATRGRGGISPILPFPSQKAELLSLLWPCTLSQEWFFNFFFFFFSRPNEMTTESSWGKWVLQFRPASISRENKTWVFRWFKLHLPVQTPAMHTPCHTH